MVLIFATSPPILLKTRKEELMGAEFDCREETRLADDVLKPAGGVLSADTFICKEGVLVKYAGAESAVEVPPGVTNIADEAFSGCANLRSVSLPNTLLEIGDYAFEGCVSLEKLVLPEGVARLGFGAFDDCVSLREVRLPSSFTSIYDVGFAFAACPALERLEGAIDLSQCADEDLSLALDWVSPLLRKTRQRLGRCVDCGDKAAPGSDLCSFCSTN